MEHENIVRCKKFLEPEELAKVEESHPEKAVSPSSLDQGVSIAEQILLKYKRSNELRQFFESRYQAQGEQIKTLKNETSDLKENINLREDKIEELSGKIGQLEILIENQQNEHMKETDELREDKAGLQKELDFMSHEQNTKELQLSDLRSKLSKRSDELQSLKDGLNSQIQQVH